MMAFSFMAFHSFCISIIILYGIIKVEHKGKFYLLNRKFSFVILLFSIQGIKSKMSIEYIEGSNNMSSNLAIDLAKW